MFPGGNGNDTAGLPNMAMLQFLRRMERTDVTVHAFRSRFREWASDATRHEPSVVEKALAHMIESKLEAACRRDDLFEERRKLVEDWTAVCGPVVLGENVATLYSAEAVA